MAHRPVVSAAAALIPEHATVHTLREAAATCRACPLWAPATQTVFGEGQPGADAMLVGEQPGDKEDLSGRPFVGPAGRILDEGLAAAGLDRLRMYLTNAVKHFKFEPRGRRRLHKSPKTAEVAACHPWLDAEIAAVRPRAIVALGATAAKSLFGADFRVSIDRGRRLPFPMATIVVATVHPSSILRQRDATARHAEMARFVDDLRVVAAALAAPAVAR